MKKLQLVCITIMLAGCSAMSGLSALKAINPMTSPSGMDINAQVGKENTSIKTRGLVNSRSDTDVDNNFKAYKIYQSTSNKDSPWLIIAFGLMCGFFVMHIFNYLKSRKLKHEKREVLNEIRYECNRVDESIA